MNNASDKGSRILNAFVAQRQAERRSVSLRPIRGALRQYDAAGQDNITFGWTASSMSANEDVRRALRIVRARSRDLAANNDYMRKFLRMVEVNVIGPEGFRFKSLAADPAAQAGATATPDEAARSLIEDAYTEFCKRGNCEITGRYSLKQAMKLAAKACARDGEFLIRRIRGKNAGNKFNYAIQLLDVDRLDDQYTGEYGDNRIIMGVEVDSMGRPVAYHLFTAHPGDSYIGRNGQRYERVPAADIIHGGVSDRPEQMRFMPWAHTAMLRLEMLGKFQTAALVAARKGAETLGVFKQTSDANPSEVPFGDGKDDQGNDFETSLPGQFETLPVGYELQQYESKYPSEVFGQFVKDALRGVASGLMVAYNGLANDLEGVSYSSIRAGVLEERDGWSDLQGFFIEAIADVIFGDWLEMSLLAGAIQYPNGSALPASKIAKFSLHKFTGRKWGWVDPKNDADANAIAVSRGWTTDAQVAADRGADWYDNVTELAAENKHAADNKVTIGTPKAAAPAPAENAS